MPAIIRKSFPTILESRRNISCHQLAGAFQRLSPPTDVYETEDSIIVRVEIAGIRDEDFEVAMENTVLMIAGIRPDRHERRAYQQMEIWFGRFEIAIDISTPVDVETSLAEYKDGFLMVNLPKAQSKQIKVKE